MAARRPLIALNPSGGVAVGMDFGKRHLSVALADLSHEVVAEERVVLADDYLADEAIVTAATLVERMLAEAGVDESGVVGVAMGIPGPIHESGLVGSSAILPGWVGAAPGQRMSHLLGRPVQARNDASLGALAEYAGGAGRGASIVVYIKLATGIGAGIVIDGLFEGAGGTAGEIGQRPSTRRATSAAAAVAAASRASLERRPSANRRRAASGEELDADAVISRAARRGVGCRRVLADAGRQIGVAVANLCNLVNPERIVVGGSMGQAGNLLLDPLIEVEEVRLRAIPSAAEDVEIVPETSASVPSCSERSPASFRRKPGFCRPNAGIGEHGHETLGGDSCRNEGK